MFTSYQIYASYVDQPNRGIIPYYLYAENTTEARDKFYRRYPNMRIEYIE